MTQQIIDDVKDYYGNVLENNKDLKTSACTITEAPPALVQDLLKNIHGTVQEKFYGCGSPIPLDAKGSTILDLGCGTGRDVYLLSQIVGEEGHVIGIDMTDEQLTIANEYIGWHMDKFGYKTPNVEFKQGYIEDLKTAGIEDESIDIVISNCVINLSPDKKSVFKEIHRVLKPGGELYFSDIFSDSRIPEDLQKDPVLLGECLSGAMTVPSFTKMMKSIGMSHINIVSERELTLDDPEIRRKIGMIDFYATTVQAYKGEPKVRNMASTGGCC